MGDFSGLQIGVSALWAQRRALETTGQNIANSATEGYTRQWSGFFGTGLLELWVKNGPLPQAA